MCCFMCRLISYWLIHFLLTLLGCNSAKGSTFVRINGFCNTFLYQFNKFGASVFTSYLHTRPNVDFVCHLRWEGLPYGNTTRGKSSLRYPTSADQAYTFLRASSGMIIFASVRIKSQSRGLKSRVVDGRLGIRLFAPGTIMLTSVLPRP